MGFNSAARFLTRVAVGTVVRVQYDGGGVLGLLTGTFQGFDASGNALFANATLFNVALPGITRVNIFSINSVTV